MQIKWFIAVLSIACFSVMFGSSHAHAKGTGYLFISSEKDNNIIVLSGKTYELVKRISTAARPRHLQFNPERTLIYAACGDGNAIDVIDVAKLELVDRIAGINDPELFDLSADGGIMYISLEDDGQLGILNLKEYFAKREEQPELDIAAASAGDEGGEDEDEEEDEDGENDEEGESIPCMSTVAVGQEPEGILLSPDGKTAYVSSEVANMVHVVDTTSLELAANIVVGNRPRRFALTPDQSELWVSNELSGSVTIIDPETNEINATIEFLPPGFRAEQVTPVGVAMTDDGNTAMVALGRANHVAFVDVPSRKIQRYVLVGNRAWNITLNRDNSLAYVANGLSDDISIIDVARRRVIKSIPTGRVPHTVLVDD